jgi:hypothetical protein
MGCGVSRGVLAIGVWVGVAVMLWVEPRRVMWRVCGGWGGWAVCCVLGQAAAVVDVWWLVGLVVVSSPLGRVLGWLLLSWARYL